MRTLLVIATVIAGTLAYAGERTTGETQTIQEILPESTGHWLLSRLGSSQHCTFHSDFSQSDKSITFSDAANCDSVHGSLISASSFVEDELGNLLMVDSENRKLFEFTSAEFDGYESVYPEYPLLTIEPVTP